MAEHKTLTTAEGIPVADNQNSLTAGDRICQGKCADKFRIMAVFALKTRLKTRGAIAFKFQIVNR
ncbi:MAG: hypothetical protein PUP93_01800 [Rhizonema sp. NSF051]|nr:hypothetical protein [Rhizonema sp. NSF051]